ncbi:MAG TPA: hypothetical protein VK824_09385, partial [Planctomycetota bacterium]|nr:hypothetical protein [Planctomycetota bacterium]
MLVAPAKLVADGLRLVTRAARSARFVALDAGTVLVALDGQGPIGGRPGVGLLAAEVLRVARPGLVALAT